VSLAYFPFLGSLSGFLRSLKILLWPGFGPTALHLPFFEATIEDADVSCPEIGKSPSHPGRGVESVVIIANKGICRPDGKSAHLLSERLQGRD
jgi:hypothetical protein